MVSVEKFLDPVYTVDVRIRTNESDGGLEKSAE